MKCKTRGKRPSKTCVKWCDGIGCYDTEEYRCLGGHWVWAWVSHCKEAEKVHSKLCK